ncbi:MAG: phosphate acetyltransferase [Candidatus Sumerlaeota bacterium]|nr:phosphate acetyltransferase [Candidatus Sumerlaeota bacterium]
MSGFIDSVIGRLKTVRTIALPEAPDPRMLEAGQIVMKAGWAKIVFVGDADEIAANAKKGGFDVANIPVFNPKTSPNLEAYCQEYWKLRGKGRPYDDVQSKKFMLNPLFYAAMMARMGEVDGVLAGAVNTTADVVRAAVGIIKCAEGVKSCSSMFVMEHPNPAFGHEGKMIYADSGVIIDPTEEQLVDIALASAETARRLLGCEPRVAFLSFSTKGSASHEKVDKMRKACEMTKQRAPQLLCDGEMQFDAAVIPAVGEKKAPGSPVAGKANVFIFPDLNAGNIGYKISERLGGANAFGPFLQGVAKPINDLSRGCKAKDIVGSIAVTALQAG